MYKDCEAISRFSSCLKKYKSFKCDNNTKNQAEFMEFMDTKYKDQELKTQDITN